MLIVEQIRELLYRYDCVIVPQLGGFVCSFSPARIHPVQHRFYPPGKRISFNQMLSMNDGLLAHSLASKEGISFAEALAAIENQVREWKQELNHKGQFSLEGIGSLHLDHHGQLQFEPENSINYSRESYGLTEFQVMPIERGKVIEMPVVKKTVVEEDHRGKLRPILVQSLRYSAAAAVISIAVIATIRLQLLPDVSLNYSSLNPFKKEKATYHSTPYHAAQDEAIDWNAATNEIGEVLVFEEGPLAGTSFEIKKDVPLSSEEKSNIIKPFQVVGGCFSIEANADKLVKKLKRRGYHASLAGKYNGLHVVAYGTFETDEAARAFLAKVQQNDNPQAWILRR